MANVYLAGPIQHSDDHGVGWRERVKSEFDAFTWLDPLAAYESHSSELYREWTDERIVEKDLSMIDNSDALLVGWDDVPSCGTPMEVFYAKRCRDIPVAVRYVGDELSPWMSVHADTVRQTFADAIADLKTLFEGGLVRDTHPTQYNAERDIESIVNKRE